MLVWVSAPCTSTLQACTGIHPALSQCWCSGGGKGYTVHYTPFTSILQVVERGAPCKYILLVMERNTPGRPFWCGGNGCTLHVYTAGGGNGCTLHGFTAGKGNGYTLRVHTAGGGNVLNTLHVHTAGGVKRYTLHVHFCPYFWRWKGYLPLHVHRWLLLVLLLLIAVENHM